MIKKINVIKIINGKKNKILDYVAEEISFDIYINKTHYITLMSSPENLEELAVGFLYSEKIIEKIDDIIKMILVKNIFCCTLKKKIYLNNNNIKKRVLLSGCEKQNMNLEIMEKIKNFKKKKKQKVIFDKNKIFELMKEFINQGDLFYKTGGVHRVSICDKNNFICGFDDIGRHNAFDKNIGYLLKNKISFKNKIIFSTGRISSDLVFKAIRCNIFFVLSRTAPTTLAVNLAKKIGVKLIGFVRGNRMNVYS